MSIQTLVSKVKPEEKRFGFKRLSNWFNNSFSNYQIEPEGNTKFKLIDRKDRALLREISKSQIARLKRRIDRAS